MTGIVESLDYINKPHPEVCKFIVDALWPDRGYNPMSRALQWVRLPDRRLPHPPMPDFATSDGVMLQRIGKSPQGEYLYAAYDSHTDRIFWMTAWMKGQRMYEKTGALPCKGE
jgi:hypothetical protein